MQGMQEIPKEHLHTFQLLIHATKTANLYMLLTTTFLFLEYTYATTYLGFVAIFCN